MIWKIHIDDSTFTSRRESLDVYMCVIKVSLFILVMCKP